MIDEKKLIEELKFQINNCETYGHSDIYIDLEMAKKWVETIEKKKVGEWIPVEERLPENCSPVLAYSVLNGVEQGCYNPSTDTWIMFRWGQLTGKVTHWRPLPDKPTSATRKKLEKTRKNSKKTRKEKQNDEFR